MRVAIWSAVSTPSQAAPDKISIELQLEKGRQFIASRGWQPAGEYIVPGESRTRFVSLYHAEKEIPALRQMLEAASRKEFDLLFIYDLNRFRALMRQVFDVLCDYGIQLYIHTQPREPVPPSLYTEEIKTTVGMIVDVSNLISRSETSSLTRHFREKMPARIAKGLHANLGGVKYGYRKIHPLDKTHPYEISPAEANVAIQIKDWYIAGWSARAICKELNTRKTPAPKGGTWHPQTVKNLLVSPFYSGMVYFGIAKYQRDRRTGKTLITPNATPHYNQGSHPPLWDDATRQRILTIMDRRGQGFRGKKTKRLTSLLKCAACGKTLHADRSRDRPNKPTFWRCSAKQRGHTFIMDHTALDLIIPKIVEAIRNIDNLSLPSTENLGDPIQRKQTEIDDLTRKRQRWLDLYENETIDPATLAARIGEIETKLSAASGELARLQTAHTQQKTAADAITQLRQIIDILPTYYRTAPPAQVNTDLRAIIESIEIGKDKQIKINWLK